MGYLMGIMKKKNSTKKGYRNYGGAKKEFRKKKNKKNKETLVKRNVVKRNKTKNKSRKNYSRKNKRVYQKGGFLNKITSILPQDLVNFNRSLIGVPANIIKGYQGYPQNASPYPTDQPFLEETARYRPLGPDFDAIESEAQNTVGKL